VSAVWRNTTGTPRGAICTDSSGSASGFNSGITLETAGLELRVRNRSRPYPHSDQRGSLLARLLVSRWGEAESCRKPLLYWHCTDSLLPSHARGRRGHGRRDDVGPRPRRDPEVPAARSERDARPGRRRSPTLLGQPVPARPRGGGPDARAAPARQPEAPGPPSTATADPRAPHWSPPKRRPPGRGAEGSGLHDLSRAPSSNWRTRTGPETPRRVQTRLVHVARGFTNRAPLDRRRSGGATARSRHPERGTEGAPDASRRRRPSSRACPATPPRQAGAPAPSDLLACGGRVDPPHWPSHRRGAGPSPRRCPPGRRVPFLR
jgi:hypothetical protein